MTCSVEQSRINGAKSSGAITERGKAIASRNAQKHGFLSSQPPLLAGEDLTTFQGILEGLINEYKPKKPSEHLLVQQVAMGWLRLHRLWCAEAASADRDSLKIPSDPEKFARYEVHIRRGLNDSLERLEKIQERRKADSITSFRFPESLVAIFDEFLAESRAGVAESEMLEGVEAEADNVNSTSNNVHLMSDDT